MKRRAGFAAMLVGCVGLAATLSTAEGDLDRESVWTKTAMATTAVIDLDAEDQRVRVFSLKELIEPGPGDPLRAPVATAPASVLTAVEAALAAAREEGTAQAQVTFHDESGLLIVRAEEPELAAVEETLNLLREDIRRARQFVAVNRTNRTGVVLDTSKVDKTRRAEMEAALKLAMIDIQRAQLEIQLRADKLNEAEQLAQAGAVSMGEVRELRAALEHAHLAMNESEARAESMKQQVKAIGQGPEAIANLRKAQAESELRLAMVAVDRAHVDLTTREAALAEMTDLHASGQVSKGEIREQQVALQHARLQMEQAEVMLHQMKAKLEAVKEQPRGTPENSNATQLHDQMRAILQEREELHQQLADLRAQADGSKNRVEPLTRELAVAEQNLALLESRLAEMQAVQVQSEQRQADQSAVNAELTRRTDQLARLQAELESVREVEAAEQRDMVMHATRLEVRLEETQRTLERKHAECDKLADRLNEMMVRAEVQAVECEMMQSEVQRLRGQLAKTQNQRDEMVQALEREIRSLKDQLERAKRKD